MTAKAKKQPQERVIWVLEEKAPKGSWVPRLMHVDHDEACVQLEAAEMSAAQHWVVKEQPCYRLVPYVRRDQVMFFCRRCGCLLAAWVTRQGTRADKCISCGEPYVRRVGK